MSKIKLVRVFFVQKREVLYVLRRAVFGHHVQHHDAKENIILYGEHYYSLHGNIVPDSTDVLPAFG